MTVKACKVRKCIPRWKCRECGAMCCEHRCTAKDPNETFATCGKCWLESSALSRKPKPATKEVTKKKSTASASKVRAPKEDLASVFSPYRIRHYRKTYDISEDVARKILDEARHGRFETINRLRAAKGWMPTHALCV